MQILENSVFVFFAISDCVTNIEQAVCVTTVQTALKYSLRVFSQSYSSGKE